jgi:hypothetical protein
MSSALLSLPSPPSPVIFEAGPFALRYYGLCIALGIAAATWLTGRELARKGYDNTLALDSLFFVIPLYFNLRGIGMDDTVWRIGQTAPSGAWSGWKHLGGRVKQIAAAQNRDGRLEVFGIGMDDAVWRIGQTSAGGPWSV